jgi:hypothetical protein
MAEGRPETCASGRRVFTARSKSNVLSSLVPIRFGSGGPPRPRSTEEIRAPLVRAPADDDFIVARGSIGRHSFVGHHAIALSQAGRP